MLFSQNISNQIIKDSMILNDIYDNTCFSNQFDSMKFFLIDVMAHDIIFLSIIF